MIMMENYVHSILKEDVPVINPDEHLTKAISEMRRKKLKQMFVSQDDLLLGVITLQHLVASKGNNTMTKIKTIMSPCPSVSRNMKIGDATRKMIQNKLEMIPVVDGKLLIGVVNLKDIIEKAQTYGRVSDIMQLSPQIINHKESLAKARSVMKNNKINKILVTDDDYKLIGEINAIDLLDLTVKATGNESFKRGEVSGDSHSIFNSEIRSILKSNVQTIDKGADVSKATAQMLSNNTDSIAVSNSKGEPIGLVHQTDILIQLLETIEDRALVEIIGLEDEDELTVELMKKTIAEYTRKISYFLDNLERVHVRIKRIHDKQARIQYEITPKIVFGKDIYSSSTKSWDLVSGVNTAFNKIQNQVKTDAEKKGEKK